MSKHIATIITDEAGVKTANLELEHCDLTLPDLNSLIAFLKKLQFNTILRRLPIVLKPFNNGELVKVAVGDLPEDNYQEKRITPNKKIFAENRDLYPGKWDNDLDKEIKNLEIKPFIVLDELLLNSFINKLNSVTQYAIDLETTGLNTLICEIAGFAFAYEENNEIKTFYIPVKHSNINTLALDLVINKLKPILEDSSKLQIIQNAKFEQKIFRRFGIKTHSNFFDTMLASYVNNPANKHGLKAQGKRVFALRMREIDELIGTGAKQVTIDLAPINDVASYASADAFVSFKLWKHYTETLSEEEKNLLYNIEFPLIEVLRDIEINGVSIDSALLKAQSLTIKQEISELESEIFSLCSSEFNIASPKQLSDILFDKLALPPVGRKNKSGSYSTDIDTLETLLVDDKVNSQNKKFIENIIQYRTLSKLISTYIDALPHLVSKEDNRLHSDFNQVVTATGRLSSSNPNLQNIPIKSKHGKLIRKAFIPRNSDYELISADYSQIELRVLADLASEPALIDAFRQDQDIHQRTAMEIFGHSSLDSVSEEERRVGKTLNFALIYMQGPFATSKQLGITMSEAKEFTDKYFRAFPKIKPFMDKVLEEAHEKECAETLFGRRRYFRNINSPNKILMKEEERQAFNAVIQGTAADIMKIAMIKLHQTLQSSQLQSQIILQVHDELVIEAHKTETDLVKTLITNSMSQAAELKVPLKVDLAIGPNWLDGN